jgi:hypothetical protein
MVAACILLGSFYGQYIAYAFYHAYQLMPPHGVGANGAKRAIAYIVAAGAKANIAPHGPYGMGKAFYLCFILLKQVQYQPEGCFFANARQFCKLLHSLFQ